jgi:S1-C subfamily serine protease
MHFDRRTLVPPLLLGAPGLAVGGPPEADLLALQDAVQNAVARVEPGVACVLVSRSDVFRILEGKRQNASSEPSGQLGEFVPPTDQSTEAIRARAQDFSQPENVPESYGSGLVIDTSGLVLTCAHVVKNATKVYVRLPGGAGSWADIHASDPRSDLAVLRLIKPPRGLRPVKFADGRRSLRKGPFVIGIANPYAAGYRDGSPSASWGIVSNLRRRAPGVITEADRTLQSFHRYGTLVQTDVRLSTGCSGGALVNLDGEVVGITTALSALTGIDAPGGMAVPVDTRMLKIIDVLRRGEEVEYGFLGVMLAQDAHLGRGVLISKALPNGPADRAGVVFNDLLVSINGEPVRENDDLFLLIGSHLAGSEVVLEVMRGSTRLKLPPVSLAKLHVAAPSIASHRPRPAGGLRVDYSCVLNQGGFGPVLFEGVVIREVLPGGPAKAIELLQPDRLITRVNGVRVDTPDDFNRAMDQSGPRVTLTVINGDHREVAVPLQLK